jgi:starch phosphorylase
MAAPNPPIGNNPEALAEKIVDALIYRIGKDQKTARPHDWLSATVLAIRDRIIDKWFASTRSAHKAGAKRVYYLSLEFLIGRLLRDAFSNMGVMEEVRDALKTLEVDLDIIREQEPDAALGNGGLGRLAACFMESLASLEIPAYGYGIRYLNGMFRQRIDDGWQVELPENWLDHGNPWEFERRESSYKVGFGGEAAADETGMIKWVPAEQVIATAFDTPVVGWRGKRVNTLRLWTAYPIDPIRLDAFNAGDHIGALVGKNRAEALIRVLYPADSSPAASLLWSRRSRSGPGCWYSTSPHDGESGATFYIQPRCTCSQCRTSSSTIRTAAPTAGWSRPSSTAARSTTGRSMSGGTSRPPAR